MDTPPWPARAAALPTPFLAAALKLTLALALALALVPGAVAPRAWAAPESQSETWYEETLDGEKTGYLQVVWAPSTWEGRKTIHDTTTIVSVTQRDMLGHKDRFARTVKVDLERGLDGTLWWQRMRIEEAGRVTVEELRWTGTGYVHSSRIEEDEPKTIEIELESPVRVDAESFLGERVRAGTLKPGDRLKLRLLDLRARKARDEILVVLGKDTIEDERGEDLECAKIAQQDPESGVEALLWLDPKGLFVQMRTGRRLIRRTTRARAESMPATPAEFRITVPGVPPLERIFNADRLWVDIHLRGDERRKMPVFPESPWSRAVGTEGDDRQGWVVKAELSSYGLHPPTRAEGETGAAPGATIPVEAPQFARYLEATALMQVRHPLVKQTVAEVVGAEKDARKAAYALARFVFTRLEKRSPEVGQADAVTILQDCHGDCSEHALVFVALCRAAGIPARLCSGYVCIGAAWGSHSWAEIWTGEWVGADPTTGEVGTAARYLFFGYPDEPGSYPGVVSDRVAGRMRIVTTRLQEGQASFDLTDESRHRIYDPERRRYLHALAGLEARDVPEGWTVSLMHDRAMRISGDGFTVNVLAQADQGNLIDTIGRRFPGQRRTFAGAPALTLGMDGSNSLFVFSRRRIVQIFSRGGSDDLMAQVEKVLAPTFADPVEPWD